MKQAWKSKSYEIIPGYEIPTLWYEMNTKGYELCHVVWNKMHRVWTTFGMVWNEKKWYVIIPHMEMRIISYRLYTISYQIWYEFFACFFLMFVITQSWNVSFPLHSWTWWSPLVSALCAKYEHKTASCAFKSSKTRPFLIAFLFD